MWFHIQQDLDTYRSKKWCYIISKNNAKIKVDSFDFLPLGKTLTLHNVIILIKSVFNKDKNNYNYNIFLKKGWYQLPKNSHNK